MVQVRRVQEELLQPAPNFDSGRTKLAQMLSWWRRLPSCGFFTVAIFVAGFGAIFVAGFAAGLEAGKATYSSNEHERGLECWHRENNVYQSLTFQIEEKEREIVSLNSDVVRLNNEIVSLNNETAQLRNSEEELQRKYEDEVQNGVERVKQLQFYREREVQRGKDNYSKIIEDLQSSLDNKTSVIDNLEKKLGDQTNMMAAVIRHVEEYKALVSEHMRKKENEIQYHQHELHELHMSQERCKGALNLAQMQCTYVQSAVPVPYSKVNLLHITKQFYHSLRPSHFF